MVKDWNDVDLRTFKRMNEISQVEDETMRVVMLISLFNDIREEDVLELPLDKFRDYVKKLGWMNIPPDIEQPRENYKINGKDYVLTMNFHKLTTGQYIDFQSYAKSDNYENILSVFLIPKGHKYNDGYDVFEVVQDMLTMPVGEVLGLMGFFIVLYRSWSRALLKYSSRMLRREARKQKNQELMETVKEMENLADMFGFR